MRVTSDWHMFPGTTIFEANNNRIDEIKVLSWKTTEMLYKGYWSDFIICEHSIKYFTYISLRDMGIPKSTYNNHATFTTYKEAEDYLKSI